jgi:hypothetical protein
VLPCLQPPLLLLLLLLLWQPCLSLCSLVLLVLLH